MTPGFSMSPLRLLLLVVSGAFCLALACTGCATKIKFKPDVSKPLNSPTMRSACCWAGSRDDPERFGYGRSDNLPVKLTPAQREKLPVGVSLAAFPEDSAPFRNISRGFKLLLVNRSASEVAFTAEDSRLQLVREAMDREGQWRPVEHLPEGFCGNSVHRVFLPVGRYWEFVVPEYTGSMKTRMRFVLERVHQGHDGSSRIYSNEFEGTVNPGQFKKPRNPYRQ